MWAVAVAVAAVTGCASGRRFAPPAVTDTDGTVEDVGALVQGAAEDIAARIDAGMDDQTQTVVQAVAQLAVAAQSIEAKTDRLADMVATEAAKPSKAVARKATAAVADAGTAVAQRALDAAKDELITQILGAKSDTQTEMRRQVDTLREVLATQEDRVAALIAARAASSVSTAATAMGGGLASLLLVWLGWLLRGPLASWLTGGKT